MTAVPLLIGNLGVGRAIFLYRSDYVRYLYTVATGMLVLKEWSLCQYEGLTQEILPWCSFVTGSFLSPVSEDVQEELTHGAGESIHVD